jgi:hypothetical protein
MWPHVNAFPCQTLRHAVTCASHEGSQYLPRVFRVAALLKVFAELPPGSAYALNHPTALQCLDMVEILSPGELLVSYPLLDIALEKLTDVYSRSSPGFPRPACLSTESAITSIARRIHFRG